MGWGLFRKEVLNLYDRLLSKSNPSHGPSPKCKHSYKYKKLHTVSEFSEISVDIFSKQLNTGAILVK